MAKRPLLNDANKEAKRNFKGALGRRAEGYHLRERPIPYKALFEV
jgi:hypothetical protein